MPVPIAQANASLARHLRGIAHAAERDSSRTIVARMMDGHVIRGWLQRTGLSVHVRNLDDEPVLELFWRTCRRAGIRLVGSEQSILYSHYLQSLRTGVPRPKRARNRPTHEQRAAIHPIVCLLIARAIYLHQANGCTLTPECTCREVVEFGHGDGISLADRTWRCPSCMEIVAQYNYPLTPRNS